jgi:hypothetical protein
MMRRMAMPKFLLHQKCRLFFPKVSLRKRAFIHMATVRETGKPVPGAMKLIDGGQ